MQDTRDAGLEGWTRTRLLHSAAGNRPKPVPPFSSCSYTAVALCSTHIRHWARWKHYFPLFPTVLRTYFSNLPSMLKTLFLSVFPPILKTIFSSFPTVMKTLFPSIFPQWWKHYFPQFSHSVEDMNLLHFPSVFPPILKIINLYSFWFFHSFEKFIWLSWKHYFVKISLHFENIIPLNFPSGVSVGEVRGFSTEIEWLQFPAPGSIGENLYISSGGSCRASPSSGSCHRNDYNENLRP